MDSLHQFSRKGLQKYGRITLELFESWKLTVGGLQQNKKAFVEFEDAQRVQKLKDTLLETSHALNINCDIISSLKKDLQTFQKEGRKSHNYGTEADFHRCDTSLDLLLVQTEQQKNRVQFLIKRTDGLLILVSTILCR